MNEYILQLFQKAKDFWSTLNKNQKIIILSIAGAIFFSIVFLVVLNMQPEPMDVLFTDIESADAGLITTKLEEMGIGYDISSDGKSIFVNKQAVHQTRMKLAAEGVPKSKGIGFEIFDQSKLGTTDFIQKINFKRALEGELVRTIESIEEVYEARIHLVIPQPTLYAEEENEPTASVTLELNQGKKLKKNNILSIQHLISRSVEALKPENIVILDNFGNMLSQMPEDDSPENRSRRQFLQKKKLENEKETKIRQFLSGLVESPDQVQAMVSIDIDFDNRKRTVEQYNPDERVIRSEQTRNKESSVTGDRENSSIRNYEISRTVSEIEETTNTITRITASVYIDGTYRRKTNTEERTVTLEFIERSETFMTKVTDLVKHAIGYNEQRDDQLTVVCLPLDKSRKEAELNAKFEQERRTFWAEHSDKIVTLILILIITGIILRVISVYLPRPVEIEEALESELAAAQEEELAEQEKEQEMEVVPEKEEEVPFEEEFEGSLLDRELTKEEKLKLRTIEELKAFAIEQPAEVANLLRGWLTEE